MHLRHLDYVCLAGRGGAISRKVHRGAKIRSGPPGCKILDTRLIYVILKSMCSKLLRI